jgi:hypothetical protein
VIDDAMQLMGGEGYMTENELERTWRDNRIHRIVEGSNEVMESFIFAYGGKQLAESMISVQEAVGLQREESFGANLSRILSNGVNPSVLKRAVPLAAELFLGKLPPAPRVEGVDASLSSYAERISQMIRVHSRHFKLVTKKHREEIIQRQAIQARLADNAIMIFALTASVSRMDRQIRDGESGPAFERDRAALKHLFDLLEVKIDQNIGELTKNADSSMLEAAAAARRHNDTLPNSGFYIHEASPVAAGTGKPVPTEHIRQFPGELAKKNDRHHGNSNGKQETTEESDAAERRR